MSTVEWTLTEAGVAEARTDEHYLWASGGVEGLFEAKVASVDALEIASNIALGSLDQAKRWAERMAAAMAVKD